MSRRRTPCLDVTADIILVIMHYEGFRPKAYKSGGTYRIGYGRTKGVKKDDRCTKGQAIRWLLEDLAPIAEYINNGCATITQQQLDALVSFAYDIGLDNFRNCTLWRRVQRYRTGKVVTSEFAKWAYCRGVRFARLEHRRQKEIDIYTNGDYSI